MSSGEKKLWENLAGLEPDSVCKGAQAAYDSAKDIPLTGKLVRPAPTACLDDMIII